MGVRINSVKVNSQAGKIWLHVMATQKGQSRTTQLGVSKIYAFCRKMYLGASSPGESDAGVTYISLRILPKMSF